MIDCHVHTARCGHAEGDASAYLAAARLAGISHLAFTEHLPLPEDLDPNRTYSMPSSELPEYVADIERMKSTAAAAESARETETKVLLGVEADWLPGRMDAVAKSLVSHPFDVVLGSVHFLDGWAFDDPGLLDVWGSADVDAVWRLYLSRLEDATRSGLFDVMAHPDLVKKFGHRPSFDVRELYRAAADAFAAAGVAVEVSTAGLRKPVGELYPSADFLAECARAGVPATLGSDAHTPAEVGYRFDAARAALRDAGYTSLVYFERRQPREVPL